MDTLLVLKDSVAFVGGKAIVFCQPCVKEVEATWLDVVIIGLICLSVATVAVYAIYRFFKWKDDERKTPNGSQGKSDGNTGPNNKVKAEYISRLLKHLESLAIIEDKAKYDKDGSDNYINELKSLIQNETKEES